MSRLIHRIFIFALLVPFLISLWVVVSYNFASSKWPIRILLSQSFNLLYLAALVVVPGAILYVAARFGQRRWLSIGCCTIAGLFSVLLSMLTLIKDGGMGIWAVSVLEAMIGIVALLTCLGLRIQQKFRIQKVQ
nr:hypothetical protein [uncultured Noviherbaspirillum sp.]